VGESGQPNWIAYFLFIPKQAFKLMRALPGILKCVCFLYTNNHSLYAVYVLKPFLIFQKMNSLKEWIL